MKKIFLSLLFLSLFCKLSFAGAVSVSQYITADDVTVAHLEIERSTFQGAINSADGGLLQTGTVTTAKLDANANPENRWNEAFNDFVYTGILPPTSASLSSTTTAGTAYIYGVRVVKDATAHTYTASKQTFVDLSSNGTYTYSEVAIGAAEPAVATNSIRLARVSTDATTVSSVRDDRVTTVKLTVASQANLVLNGATSGTITLSPAAVAGTSAYTLPAMTGAPILSTLTTNAETVANSVTGGTNQLIFEGATGDTIQTFLTVIDPTASDKTITLPNVTGTVLLSGTNNTNTTQAAFLVTPTAQQANIATGSDVTVVFGTEIFDQGGNFAANTFTAPVTGKYLLTFTLFCSDLDTAATFYQPAITTSNRGYLTRFTANQFVADVANWSLFYSVVADMDVNDTAYVVFNQSAGTAQTDIETYSTFSGALLF